MTLILPEQYFFFCIEKVLCHKQQVLKDLLKSLCPVIVYLAVISRKTNWVHYQEIVVIANF